MSGHFWLTDAQMERLRPFFPSSRGKPRVDDRRVLSGIIYIPKNGLQRKDAPAMYRPSKALYNRFVRWSRMGVFARIFAELAQPGPDGAEEELGASVVAGGDPAPVLEPSDQVLDPVTLFVAVFGRGWRGSCARAGPGCRQQFPCHQGLRGTNQRGSLCRPGAFLRAAGHPAGPARPSHRSSGRTTGRRSEGGQARRTACAAWSTAHLWCARSPAFESPS